MGLILIAVQLHLELAFFLASGDKGQMDAPHETMTDQSVPQDWRDRLGICLSVLCLVHCLLTPVLLGLVPVGAAIGFWQHGFHQVFLLVVPFVALIAFVPGWKRHRDSRVWQWGVLGVFFLASGVVAAEIWGHSTTGVSWPSLALESALTIVGGACLIRAHLLNRQLCACCEQHKHSHKAPHGSA